MPNEGNFWDTDFVAIHGNKLKKIHFVYKIFLKDKQENTTPKIFRGYCELTPTEKEDKDGKAVINELTGTYTHLAPGQLSGNITFTRISKEEAIKLIQQKIIDSNASN